MNENTQFITQLMAHILEGVRIPKVQVERAVGPILGFFIADVLTKTLKDDDELRGQYRMLSPEFPLLKKHGNLQSTNIDWLLYNETRKELVFLELKTARSSFSPEQAVIYLENKLKVLDKGAAFLVEDLEKIGAASSEQQKYEFVRRIIEERFPGGSSAMAACHSVKIIYLVPAPVRENSEHLKRIDKVLSFSELADEIEGPFADEWRAICHALRQLDGSAGPGSDNHKLKMTGRNYQGRESFKKIKSLCAERGAQIVVGFTGGETALQEASTDSLLQRQYKWDLTEGGQGSKHDANWIAGDRFFEIVAGISEHQAAPDAPVCTPFRK